MHGQRRLLSATRLGVLLLGLVAAICLAIAAALVTPNWSPLLRSPLPDPSASSVGDRIVVRERPVPVQRPSEAGRGDPAVEISSDDLPASAPASEVEQPSAPVSAPAVVVSAPTPPERGASAPGGGRPSPAPAASPAPAPAPAPVPPTAAESPPEVPPPPPPEAVISTHPGQGNAYGKGSGNGPQGGVPPGQVGR